MGSDNSKQKTVQNNNNNNNNITTDVEPDNTITFTNNLLDKTVTFNSIVPKNGKQCLQNPYAKTTLKKIINHQNFYTKKHKILFASEELDEEFLSCSPRNGLISTVFHAYSKHIPLKIKPDDLWISICNTLGIYVTSCSTESEEHVKVRKFFVSHEGKKELDIHIDSFSKHNIGEVTDAMCEEIRKNVNHDIIDWLTPKFSTTTPIDKLACQISIMNVVKQFFGYNCILDCGLSQITLMGTKDDWLTLRDKIFKIYDINSNILNEWLSVLLPVIDKFILLFDNIASFHFWQRICTSKSVGSGGDLKYGGWIFVFSPFDSEGKYLLKSKEDIKKNHIYTDLFSSDAAMDMASVPVAIHDKGNNCTYNLLFCAGIFGGKYDELKNQIEPTVGYCVVNTLDLTLDLMTKLVIKNCQKTLESSYMVGKNVVLSDKQKDCIEKRTILIKELALLYCKFIHEVRNVLQLEEKDVMELIDFIIIFINNIRESKSDNIYDHDINKRFSDMILFIRQSNYFTRHFSNKIMSVSNQVVANIVANSVAETKI